jgi:thioredoxin reductase (NADPH)
VVFLASHAARVHLLIRGNDLGKNMSKYLVDRIGSLPNVTLHTETEICAIEGCAEGVSGVRWRHRRNGHEESRPIRRVFLFVGADPNTTWLADCGIKLNDKGFVCTGVDLAAAEDGRSQDGPARAPYPLETSIPGVFAIGDVRASSTKRVAAAVGEGAAVVAQVHAWLAANSNPASAPGART